MVASMKFFLGKDEEEEKDTDDEDDLPAIRDVKLANKVNNKNVRKREKLIENIKKAHKRKKRKEKTENKLNFSAVHLIHDPQSFAERLFKKTEALKEKFEVRLLYLDLVSRLIGIHQVSHKYLIFGKRIFWSTMFFAQPRASA
jgi:protein SDA1